MGLSPLPLRGGRAPHRKMADEPAALIEEIDAL